MPTSATASAPSQAFLLGEHAVLYGSPALALSVERRSYATVKRADSGILKIRSRELGMYFEKKGEVISGNEELARLVSGLKEFLNLHSIHLGFEILIESEVPAGSGMASSASVSASIVKAIDAIAGLNLDLNGLLEAVYIFERAIHGRASKTGPACAVLGGAVWVERRDGEMRAESLGHYDLPLVVTCTGEPSRTKEMIERVAELKEAYDSIHGAVIRAISEIVEKGREAMVSKNLEELGRLMDLNHGLLYTLGVSGLSIERIVWEARKAGALGAKLSGAGGGGCVVALHPDPRALARRLNTIAPLSFPALVAKEGARIERLD